MENKNFNFTFNLKCYPVSFIQKFELENGDKIILPPSILQHLSTLDIQWPLMFEVKSGNSGKITHCGVMEFIADEGCAYIPYWMMQNLAIIEGEKLNFKYKNLEKGNFVKIQPQSSDFLEISNIKAVLESKLRNFTCLTKSDSIAIEYNEVIYWLNVMEVKPGIAISIVETDVNIDFMEPKNRGNTINPQIQNENSEDEESSA
jgi:ubiquitin fusion degradation protein 1